MLALSCELIDGERDTLEKCEGEVHSWRNVDAVGLEASVKR